MTISRIDNEEQILGYFLSRSFLQIILQDFSKTLAFYKSMFPFITKTKFHAGEVVNINHWMQMSN